MADLLVGATYISALLSLIVAVVLSITRNLRAAAVASFVLTVPSVIFGVATLFLIPRSGPYGGMLLFFVVPPAFLALSACAIWWLLLLIAKLRGRDV